MSYFFSMILFTTLVISFHLASGSPKLFLVETEGKKGTTDIEDGKGSYYGEDYSDGGSHVEFKAYEHHRQNQEPANGDLENPDDAGHCYCPCTKGSDYSHIEFKQAVIDRQLCPDGINMCCPCPCGNDTDSVKGTGETDNPGVPEPEPAPAPEDAGKDGLTEPAPAPEDTGKDGLPEPAPAPEDTGKDGQTEPAPPAPEDTGKDGQTESAPEDTGKAGDKPAVVYDELDADSNKTVSDNYVLDPKKNNGLFRSKKP